MTTQLLVPTLRRHCRWYRSMLVAGVLLLSTVACGDLVGNAMLPSGTWSPNSYNTADGALGVYRGVIANVQSTLRSVIVRSGAFTDELTYKELGRTLGSIGGQGDPTDERILDAQSESNDPYSSLQGIRGSAAEAIGLLANYAPNVSPALRGELYAFQGYAELMLTELYCSGVPLSTLDFQGDFTYQPGSSQEAVYTHAIALFDSALAISTDSASIMAFASVEKGRALLDLGQYTQAAQAVADVQTTFRDSLLVQFAPPTQYYYFKAWSVASNEGINGLPFGSGADPRVQVQSVPSDTNQFGVPHITPAQYPAGRVSPVIIASGIEARLIEAEAALNSGSADWLTILNTLRTTCTNTATCPSPASAGTGSVAGLPPLTDPGSDTARVSMLFRERAYWLFLTGHRQGDLRRLVRNYNRAANAVYPTGVYYGGLGTYGNNVNFPIPNSEDVNPLFHGCLSQGA